MGKIGNGISLTYMNLYIFELFTTFFTLINLKKKKHLSILEKYMWLHKYVLPFGCLCLVPGGSSPVLHYQIYRSKRTLETYNIDK